MTTTTDNLQQILLREIRLLLSPLAVVTESGPAGRLLFDITGWSLQGDPSTTPQLLQFVNAYKALDEVIESAPESIWDVIETVDRVTHLITLVDQVPVDAAAVGVLGGNLVEALVIDYLKTWHPLIYDILVVVTAIQPPHISLARLSELINDPIALLRDEYVGANGLVTADDARIAADRLFPRLAALLSHFGLQAVYGGAPPNGPIPSNIAGQINGGTLSVFMQPNFEDPDRYAVTFGLSPKDLGDLGLVVIPSGTVSPYWDADIDLTPAASGLAIGPNGLTLLGASSEFSTQAIAFDLPGVTVGSDAGTRLEIGRFEVSGSLGLTAKEQEYGGVIDLGNCTLVVATGDGDSFLASFLGADGLSANFDLSFGWSNKKGFFFEGSGSVEIVVPVHKDLGLISIKQVVLRIEIDDSTLGGVAAVSFGVHIGPVHVEIDRLGVRADTEFGGEQPNLGVVDLAIGLSPPTGAGISVNGGPVSGGGFLSHDPVRGRYAGAITLSMLNLGLGAYGVLDTKVPWGYSLLIAIQARIPPIQLGFGFTLLGVGGLIGVNRTAALDVIRDGLRGGGLAKVLYPDDPVGDFDQIVAEVDRIFPIQQGRYLVGPTAKIGWGSPTLITADIGLVIDLPDPVRLAILGVVRCMLPDADKPLLTLQAAFLGTVDLAKGQLAFDASLFDSHLLSFTIDGDMAARLHLGLLPNYLITVGGFHPAYTPPPMGLPALRRITLNLLAGENPRLRADLYFARTSNSFQLGGHVELYAAISKFNIYGFVGFDTLVQVRPTKLATSVKATLAVRIGEDPILSVGVEFSLEGPSPWHAVGSAHFKVCWFLSFSVHFDRTWGDIITVLAGAIDVLPLLGAALGDPANWLAPLPAGSHAVVTLRRSDDRLVDPAGTLTISQKLVPLGLAIDRFSSLKPRDATTFAISSITSGGVALETKPSDDEFAAAEFFDMSDAEKLSRPSFERFASGVTIASAETLVADDVISTEIDYERIIIDREGPSRPSGRTVLEASVLDGLVRGAAISRSPLAANRQLAPTSATVSLAAETFTVISSIDLTPASARRELTYAEAVAELDRLRETSSELQIAATSEIAS